MIIEAVALGSITLTYKPPEPPPIEMGRPVSTVQLLEPIQAVEVVPEAPKEVKPLVRPANGPNTYTKLQCTWWVKEWKNDVPNTWGNANTWDDRALLDGWIVSPVPIVGAVAQSDRGGYGHVAVVEAVNGDGTVTIREGNYDYKGSVRTKTVPITTYTYIY